jgi:uncharacterized membrane protein
MAETQNYSNHTRWFPLVHFVILPLLLLNVLYQIFRFYQEPGTVRGVWVVICILFVLVALSARVMALKVQDRVIRLEERLRYKELLSAEMAQKASNLPVAQIVALRFASDDELGDLVTQVLDGKLTTQKEIKMAVKNWRGDYLRA